MLIFFALFLFHLALQNERYKMLKDRSNIDEKESRIGLLITNLDEKESKLRQMMGTMKEQQDQWQRSITDLKVLICQISRCFLVWLVSYDCGRQHGCHLNNSSSQYLKIFTFFFIMFFFLLFIIL